MIQNAVELIGPYMPIGDHAVPEITDQGGSVTTPMGWCGGRKAGPRLPARPSRMALQNGTRPYCIRARSLWTVLVC